MAEIKYYNHNYNLFISPSFIYLEITKKDFVSHLILENLLQKNLNIIDNFRCTLTDLQIAMCLALLMVGIFNLFFT